MTVFSPVAMEEVSVKNSLLNLPVVGEEGVLADVRSLKLERTDRLSLNAMGIGGGPASSGFSGRG